MYTVTGWNDGTFDQIKGLGFLPAECSFVHLTSKGEFTNRIVTSESRLSAGNTGRFGIKVGLPMTLRERPDTQDSDSDPSKLQVYTADRTVMGHVQYAMLCSLMKASPTELQLTSDSLIDSPSAFPSIMQKWLEQATSFAGLSAQDEPVSEEQCDEVRSEALRPSLDDPIHKMQVTIGVEDEDDESGTTVTVAA